MKLKLHVTRIEDVAVPDNLFELFQEGLQKLPLVVTYPYCSYGYRVGDRAPKLLLRSSSVMNDATVLLSKEALLQTASRILEDLLSERNQPPLTLPRLASEHRVRILAAIGYDSFWKRRDLAQVIAVAYCWDMMRLPSFPQTSITYPTNFLQDIYDTETVVARMHFHGFVLQNSCFFKPYGTLSMPMAEAPYWLASLSPDNP